MTTRLPRGFQFVTSNEVSARALSELFCTHPSWEEAPSSIERFRLRVMSEQISRIDVGVITEEDLLVGYGSVYAKGACGEFSEFFVNPDYRSRGIGKAIIRERLARAATGGIDSLYMPYLEATNTLESYYLGLGFRWTDLGELVRGPNPVPIVPSCTDPA